MPENSDWISCSGCENSRSSGKKPNFDPKPQKTRNDSSYNLFIWGRAPVALATLNDSSYNSDEPATPAQRRASMTWAQRLKRVFNIDIETCSGCGGAMKVIA
ncbi:hypothetical protein AB6W79_11080, partial [Pasteurella multocida]